ncbi:hypothetical protein GOODEAATRI_014187 [Goodea atripinnis]|uniref:Uncharacterized protein n=1 Tax=Goodea atripinnis TaxID=208336 RepID=A0ABV0PDZ9_9TELE
MVRRQALVFQAKVTVEDEFFRNQKGVNSIKSCLKVLNKCRENIPHFVSHFLDELPPVMFNSIDVSHLLSKMERLYSEACALRQTVTRQVDVGEKLRAFTTTIDHRVAAVEQHLVPYCRELHNKDMIALGILSASKLTSW